MTPVWFATGLRDLRKRNRGVDEEHAPADEQDQHEDVNPAIRWSICPPWVVASAGVRASQSCVLDVLWSWDHSLSSSRSAALARLRR